MKVQWRGSQGMTCSSICDILPAMLVGTKRDELFYWWLWLFKGTYLSTYSSSSHIYIHGVQYDEAFLYHTMLSLLGVMTYSGDISAVSQNVQSSHPHPQE